MINKLIERTSQFIASYKLTDIAECLGLDGNICDVVLTPADRIKYISLTGAVKRAISYEMSFDSLDVLHKNYYFNEVLNKIFTISDEILDKHNVDKWAIKIGTTNLVSGLQFLIQTFGKKDDINNFKLTKGKIDSDDFGRFCDTISSFGLSKDIIDDIKERVVLGVEIRNVEKIDRQIEHLKEKILKATNEIVVSGRKSFSYREDYLDYLETFFEVINKYKEEGHDAIWSPF